MASILRITHIALHVADLDACVALVSLFMDVSSEMIHSLVGAGFQRPVGNPRTFSG